MNNNGGVCVMDIIEKLASLAVDCDFLSTEEDKTFYSLPKGFRNSDLGATMHNVAVVLKNVAGEARYLKEQLESIMD